MHTIRGFRLDRLLRSDMERGRVRMERQGDSMNQKLIDQVLAQIKIDMKYGDMTAIAELIEALATGQTGQQVLKNYIGESQ